MPIATLLASTKIELEDMAEASSGNFAMCHGCPGFERTEQGNHDYHIVFAHNHSERMK